tara:strand:+ start:297 stop:479 length:183 start_codon:yes stop_codon:yes gene_type:complete
MEKLNQKTKKKFLHRLRILNFLGDASIDYSYLKLSDEELMESYSWVLSSKWDKSLDSIEC